MWSTQFLVAVCAFGFALTPAVTAPPTHQPGIVIEGKLKSILRNFVSSMTQAGPTGQLARWKQEVCPSVIGLAPSQAQFMEDSIVEIAKKLGLRRGGSGCVTTLAVIVTPDAHGFANGLVRQYPVTLSSDGRSRMKSFAATSQPVRWISVTNELNECLFVNVCELPNSRLKKTTKAVLHTMIIVIDAQQITNFSIGELSDYVSLVALSNPPLNSRKSTNSILSMFDGPRGDGGPFELTGYDRSFLSGLYGTMIDTDSKQQRSTIANHMKKDAQKSRSVRNGSKAD